MRAYVLYLLSLCTVTATMVGCSDSSSTWVQEDGYRYRELQIKGASRTGFSEVSPSQSGITAVNRVTQDEIVENRHMMHGSGIAIGDVTGDELPDVYVARLNAQDILYRNLGDWEFEDISKWSGLDSAATSTSGVVMIDIDGDQDLDLLLTMPFGPGMVYHNDGYGRFKKIPKVAGLESSYASTTATLADVDLDGDLDIYIARYKRISLADSLPAEKITWDAVLQKDQHIPKAEFQDHYKFTTFGTQVLRSELAEPDGLYLNDGSGNFSIVSWTEGAFLDVDGTPLDSPPRDWALTAKFYDITGDGIADLFVCNDFDSLDELWIGLGDGRFQRAPHEALRKISNATMSVDFSDVDRDGITDFFTTDMLSRDDGMRLRQRNTRIPINAPQGDGFFRPQEMQNSLMIGRGDTTFAELAWFAEIAASDWSWSTGFMDVDLDGWEDILITNGHVFDVQDLDAQIIEQRSLAGARSWTEARRLILNFPPLSLQNVAFRNRRDLTFEDMPDGWGFGEQQDIAHGMAFGDLDGDGDLDIITNRLYASPGIYRNTSKADRLTVMLEGISPNTSGIGATIQVQCSGLPTQTKQITAGGSYLSSNQHIAVFAVDHPPCQMEVTWQSTQRSKVQIDEVNRLYVVQESGAEDVNDSVEQSTLSPIFQLHEELPPTLEDDFDDSSVQPLLPWRLSRRGPALAAIDLNGDGQDELLQGGGRLQTLRLNHNPILDSLLGDATAIVGIPIESDVTRIFFGESNYENQLDTSWVHIYDITSHAQLLRHQKIPFGQATPGPISVDDIDLDGDLDLFVGGHFIPQSYPHFADSRIFVNNNGDYTFSPALSAPFRALGLISGSVFGDLDQDGYSELILASEWGPIQVFKGSPNGFTNQTEALGFTSWRGWWRGASLGDFDGDGRLDIVASNAGWNHRYRDDIKVRLYYGDFNLDGRTELLESFLDPATSIFRPSRMLDEIVQVIPPSFMQINSYTEFSQSSVSELIPSHRSDVQFIESDTYASGIFLNQEDHFEFQPLPMKAQQSAAISPIVIDANKDGHEDIVLSQNWFAFPLSTPRQDAGRGLLLLGNGDGTFNIARHSGFKVYGEGRGISVGDFDGDDQQEIAFAQHNGSTLIYKLTQELRNVSIDFEEPSDAVGTILRIVYEDGQFGPARIVTAGNGYWSHSALSTSLGMIDAPIHAVEVTWPGQPPERITVNPKSMTLVLKK
ncbi:MAG: VCBS repeat-containing protein [Bacteroidetes bacterium]|nr:VCBS repeat-containing protein [Bacteroidota bacterium]